jgi:uncharacterized protein YjbJ (UPF0337 family)
MTKARDWIAGVADEAAGLAKRAIGELSARPDLVLEGEKQQASGRAEIEAARDDGSPAEKTVIGWKLDPSERFVLLGRFAPRYARAVADHVTLATNMSPDTPLPAPCSATIVGEADDGSGVQALVVAIDGKTDRPGGGTFHVTWSLSPGRHAGESNDVIASFGWSPLAEPVAIALFPARF